MGQKLGHHCRVGGVTVGDETGAGHLGQGKGHHAGHEEDENRREFKKSGQNGSATGFLLVFTRQHTLDDVLIRAPVPESNNRRTWQNRQPGPLGIIIGSDQMDIGTHSRLGGVPALKQVTVAQLTQTEVKNTERAKDQHGRLQDCGVHDDTHTAKNRVNTGRESQSQGNDPKDVDGVSEDIHRVDAEQGANDHISSVNRRRDLGQHKTCNGKQTQHVP